MKSCLLRLALLPLIVAVTYVVLSIRNPFPTFVFPAPAAEVAAPAAGFFFWFAILYWLHSRQARASLALAHQAVTRHLRDGEKATVYGSLEARGPLLESPFSGKSCVGYYYTVHHRNPTMRSDQIDYEGCALTPSAVRGPMGSMGILAAADKELFHEVPFESLHGEEAFACARGYLDAIDFGEPLGLLGNVSRRKIVDGPGSFRMDESAGAPTDLRTCSLKEKVLRPGDEVSVAGIYSEPERGIGPDPGSIMNPFHIVPGGEAALARKIHSRRTAAVVCASLGLAVVAIYFFVAG